MYFILTQFKNLFNTYIYFLRVIEQTLVQTVKALNLIWENVCFN